MKNVKILRVYASNTDKIGHATLYEALAYAAKRSGLMGATIYKGIMGYGSSSELVSDKFWELTDKTPVIIEIIDEAEKIDLFVKQISPWLEEQPKGCLVTLSDASVVLHKSGKKA